MPNTVHEVVALQKISGFYAAGRSCVQLQQESILQTAKQPASFSGRKGKV
jgi:hypothetical protein